MNITHHGCPLTSKQILSVALHFFANQFFYNINKVEYVSRANLCSTILIKCIILEDVIHSVWYNTTKYNQG